MSTLYARDAAVIAGIEKLRFFPLEVQSGHGCLLTTPDGRELLDLSATWTASGLGHGHPAVVEAVSRAIRNAPGSGGLSAVHPDSVGLAEDLLALVPGDGERRVYLGHAGSDANDVALRACRHATGRRTVVAFEHSYHGGVGLAMGVSGVHVDAGAPADPDAVFLPYPNPFRPGPDGVEADVTACLELADQHLRGGRVACLIVEPILSDGGLVVPPDGFLAQLHEVCRRHGVPMICDEVKMGLGRPGTLHAFEHDGVVPDIVTFGKVIGGGLPLSAAVGPAEILDNPPAAALLTTAGNPVCTAAGRAVLETIVSDGLVENAATVGAVLADSLRGLADSPGGDRIGDVRGRGLAVGLELVDPETGDRDPRLAAAVVYRAWELGAVVYYVGGNVLEITPPLVLTESQAMQAAEILGAAIGDAAAGKVDAEEVAKYAGW
ncbi:aspartate aminotransferase family protein [Mycolicibacterium chubuense]|uniref:Acetylornithine aminotransferase n=1 Tax=Mycolicibacterium chubuense TaxID=1800 RepID=A0A0J6Z2J8_MYCCU|nr:aspartate aminotransferase family protein [Mycolicibacterium chubuense]KMO78896.1 Acetylornithine aminotransferase [Mycolicibacterium chubuense]ORA50199.1 aspartate aminotransferase family protein [Mycolicibacterium chubuense]SPX96210.1 4-aminobutyrate aminotransferase family protein [Mycolicibacterium chubuense]